MFIKMKRNLFKYFGKKKDQPQEENMEKVSENIKLKEEDPKEKLIKINKE